MSHQFLKLFTSSYLAVFLLDLSFSGLFATNLDKDDSKGFSDFYAELFGYEKIPMREVKIDECKRKIAKSCHDLAVFFYESNLLRSAESHFYLGCFYGYKASCNSFEELFKDRRNKEGSIRRTLKRTKKACDRKNKRIACSKLAYDFAVLGEWETSLKYHQKACNMGEPFACLGASKFEAIVEDAKEKQKLFLENLKDAEDFVDQKQSIYHQRAYHLLEYYESVKRQDFGVLKSDQDIESNSIPSASDEDNPEDF